MKIEEAKEAIVELLNDPYPSGAVVAVKELFKAMLKCSLGWKEGVGKSGPFGVLDLENTRAINMVMNDPEARIELCHMIYYGLQKQEIINEGE